MKSESGVTLTSVIIYVAALTIIVIAIGRISTYFYRNVNSVNSDAKADMEYMKFNSYFTKEVNIKNNDVYECTTTEDGANYINFKISKNQYTWQNGKIYMGKVKICNNVENCEFEYDNLAKTITVSMTINGSNYNTTYKVIE